MKSKERKEKEAKEKQQLEREKKKEERESLKKPKALEKEKKQQEKKTSTYRPAQFINTDDSSDSSGNESDIVCGKYNLREPYQCNDKRVFWIDYEECKKWFLVLCIPKKSY